MTPFFLIDFENVQPKALDRLKPGAARIKVFLGQHQSKLMLDLVRALQPFGSDAEYIQIQGSGPDAVDFHIAFYIGRLAAVHPDAVFNIISRDRGFDPLVRHLATLGIACRRLPEIPEDAPALVASAPAKAAPAAKPKAAKSAAKKTKSTKAAKTTTVPAATARSGASADKAGVAESRVNEAIERLRKSSRPARLSTLRSSIRAWFQPALDDAQVDAVIARLRDSGRIAIAGTRVTYALE